MIHCQEAYPRTFPFRHRLDDLATFTPKAANQILIRQVNGKFAGDRLRQVCENGHQVSSGGVSSRSGSVRHNSGRAADRFGVHYSRRDRLSADEDLV